MNERCLICGYELAGLEDDAVCPECTASVGDSRHGRIIETASRAHRQALRTGFAMAACGAAAMIIFSALNDIANQLLFQLFIDDMTEVALQILNISAISFIILNLAGFLVVVIGWLRATRSDDRFEAGDRMAPLRRWTRVAIIAEFCLYSLAMAGFIVFSSIDVSMSAMVNTVLIAMQVFSGLAFLAGVATFVLQILFMRAILRRLGREAMRRRLTHLLWIVPVLTVLHYVAMILLMTQASHEVGDWPRFGLEMIAAIVWFALWVGALRRVHAALPRA